MTVWRLLAIGVAIGGGKVHAPAREQFVHLAADDLTVVLHNISLKEVVQVAYLLLVRGSGIQGVIYVPLVGGG